MSAAGDLDGFLGLQHRIPSADERAELLARLLVAREGGDRATYAKLCARYIATQMRAVLGVVRRYRGRGLELEDLLSIGLVALAKALETWDPNAGANLTRYATLAIRHAAFRAIEELGSVVRRPCYMHAEARKVARAEGRFRQLHGREPSPEEIAALTELPVTTVERVLALGPGVAVSLDAPAHDEEVGGDAQLDALADEAAESPEDTLLRREREAEAWGLLDAIPHERNRAIVSMRFGVGTVDGETLPLEVVGARFGLTRERVRQIEASALDRLRGRGRGRLRLVPPLPEAPTPRAPRTRATATSAGSA